jgi:antitoxin (DNA-binding transcriptional repressor) of toxin-antitoxin stability system
MIAVNARGARVRRSALLRAVVGFGETVVICCNGSPIAELRRLAPSRDPPRLDRTLRRVRFVADPALPLDPDDWPGSK